MNLTFIFWLSACYTVLLFGLQVYEVLTGLPPFNFAALNAAYLALLSAYVGSKEVHRWTKPVEASAEVIVNRPWRLAGEWFVGLWAAALPVVSLMVQFWPGRFHYPSGLTTITLEVLGFYLGSNVSRWLKGRDTKAQVGLERELTQSAEETSAPEDGVSQRRISRKRQQYEVKIMDQAGKQGSVTREEVEKITRLKESAAGTLLNGMVDRGLLRLTAAAGSHQARYEPVSPV